MFGGQIDGPQSSGNGSPFRGLMSLVLFAVVIYLAFTVFAWLYKMLWAAVPFILGAVAILDHKLLLGLVRRLGKLTERNLIGGLFVGAITVFSLPFLSVILLFIALIRRSFKKKMSQQQGEMQSMFEIFQQQQQGHSRQSEPRDIDIDYEELPAKPQGGKDFV